jgi:hypothetical protein
MKYSTNVAYRGKAVGRQVSRDHDWSALAERIGQGAILTGAGRNRWHLLAADDHHQELMRPGKRDRRPRADSSTDQTMTQAAPPTWQGLQRHPDQASTNLPRTARPGKVTWGWLRPAGQGDKKCR